MSPGQKSRRIITNAFHKYKEDPDQWGDTASLLRRAAQLLFTAEQKSGPDANGEPIHPEDQGIDNPATLLYGYAIENAIKGYLIEKLNGYKNAEQEAGHAWNHCLCDLAGKTGLPLTDDQRHLLRTLQSFVIWAGRYPIPKKPEKFDFLIPLDNKDVLLMDDFFDAMLRGLESDPRKHLMDEPPTTT
jgi:hypothetical protein